MRVGLIIISSLFTAVFIPSAFASPAQMDLHNCLTSAYPQSISAVKDGKIYFTNGKTILVGEVSDTPFMTRLAQASVADQLALTYPLHFNPPKQYDDAGRLRNDAFFTAMYGSTLAEVQKNMATINWQPSGTKLSFNQLNGAAAQLEKVGNEIAQDPTLSPYVSKSLGTLNFRKIAGTNRLSAHSFGVAVDFHLPKAQHKYWRWDGCTREDKACPYPAALLADDNLKKVVKIFEAHGFIWGGKWASYDSPHFEYRPELLIQACR